VITPHPIQKIWQLRSQAVCLQLNLGKSSADEKRKKVYLILGLKGLSLSVTKPADLFSEGAFTTFLRSRCPRAFLVKIWRDKKNSIVDIINADRHPYSLILENNSILHVADNERSLLRLSHESTFTKAKEFKFDRSTLKECAFESLLESNMDANTPKEQQPKDAEAPALKRKRRTLRKAREKILSKWVDETELKAVEDHIAIEQQNIAEGDLEAGLALDEAYSTRKRLVKAMKMQEKRLAEVDRQIADLSCDAGGLGNQPLKQQIVATRKKKDSERKGYRAFLRDGVKLYVGKSAVENDQLTKAAKGNDLWIHVTSGVGSHVIVPARYAKHPQAVFWGAMLAIHFSSFKEAKDAEVYVTTRSQLRKTKGLPAGKWIVGSAQTQRVRYNDEDLKQLYAFEVV
jgi:hypothetical protein